jgi:hypothetical protein
MARKGEPWTVALLVGDDQEIEVSSILGATYLALHVALLAWNLTGSLFFRRSSAEHADNRALHGGD